MMDIALPLLSFIPTFHFIVIYVCFVYLSFHRSADSFCSMSCFFLLFPGGEYTLCVTDLVSFFYSGLF